MFISYRSLIVSSILILINRVVLREIHYRADQWRKGMKSVRSIRFNNSNYSISIYARTNY